MITDICTPAELRLCCQTERIGNENKLRDSAPKIEEVEQKKKVILYSCYFDVEKNISAHAQSVGVTDVESEVDSILARASMFTAHDDISRMSICPALRSSLGTG